VDNRQFDQWTRKLSALGSRRAVTKTLAAGILGALVGHIGGESAAAKCVKPGKRCDKRNPKQSKCCGGATCRGKKCRCPTGRVACGARCCTTREICAGGKCVTGRGSCPNDVDSCAGTPVVCNGSAACACMRRLQGGTRCGEARPASACSQCATDGDCLAMGFPAGSSCVSDDGPSCGCPDGQFGLCAAPCGLGGG